MIKEYGCRKIPLCPNDSKFALRSEIKVKKIERDNVSEGDRREGGSRAALGCQFSQAKNGPAIAVLRLLTGVLSEHSSPKPEQPASQSTQTEKAIISRPLDKESLVRILSVAKGLTMIGIEFFVQIP